jgi:hypothetical protein
VKRSKHDERAEVLFDLLADGDHTYESIGEKTGWSRNQILKAVQRLRDILAVNGDVISVVCEPQGQYEPYAYRLKGGKEILDAEKTRWAINRTKDLDRRGRTFENVLAVAVKATDGRTLVGKKARIWHLHIKRAREEVALMEPEQLELDG